ncbi:MAG: biotin/lipoyl-binding protein, partial [Candidatus Dormibacteraeota bacterium]|nr:biotin/lipoyl-binding protein [Candidatus Dormibacteraeota bacterium]
MNDVSAPHRPAMTLPVSRRRYLWAAVALAVLLAVWGIASRLITRHTLAHEARDAAVLNVITTQPHRGPALDTLILPGSVQAYYEAPIYARTTGYLKTWYTDIGAPVKKGQLLAEIETPEVDQQLRQAEADLGTARANYELARTTNERWQGLLATQSVSQQDADQRAGDAAAKAAAQASAAANVARLHEL